MELSTNQDEFCTCLSAMWVSWLQKSPTEEDYADGIVKHPWRFVLEVCFWFHLRTVLKSWLKARVMFFFFILTLLWNFLPSAFSVPKKTQQRKVPSPLVYMPFNMMWQCASFPIYNTFPWATACSWFICRQPASVTLKQAVCIWGKIALQYLNSQRNKCMLSFKKSIG